jgi:uncharacterized protein YehS (DUF1456 family)
MINNDILRRIRYALDLNDTTMIAIFALANYQITHDELLNLLKKDDADGFVALNNQRMMLFLDGLISYKRGKQDNPPVEAAGSELDNNTILRKLRIALAFKDEDMLNTLKLADFALSKSELSAFFRQKDHKHYRKCGDQVLRNFLQGLAIHCRKSNKP